LIAQRYNMLGVTQASRGRETCSISWWLPSWRPYLSAQPSCRSRPPQLRATTGSITAITTIAIAAVGAMAPSARSPAGSGGRWWRGGGGGGGGGGAAGGGGGGADHRKKAPPGWGGAGGGGGGGARRGPPPAEPLAGPKRPASNIPGQWGRSSALSYRARRCS